MNETVTNQQESPDQLSDTLLVIDKKKNTLRAIKGIGKDGELETVEPLRKNQDQFIRVDKTGNFFSNFFSNFLRQLKEPTRFSFLHIPINEVERIGTEIRKHITSPSKNGETLLNRHEIKTDQQQNIKNNTTMATVQTSQQPESASQYRYQPEQINWEHLSQMGLTKEYLEKRNLLDALLKGYKTELVPVSLNLGSAVTRMDARLSLQPGGDNTAVIALHGIRKEPQLNFEFFGHRFSDQDKENLLKTGNMGRVVPLNNPKTGETMQSFVSVDRLTNELVALRSDRIKIPDEIKGLMLDAQQKQTLQQGKPLYLEGMISKKGEPFNATVQVNADKRYVEFLFDRNNVQKQTPQQQGQEAPRTIRGKELDQEQYNKFKDGQTIYVTGLVDKEGKEYKGYLTFNKETGKTGFSYSNPNKQKKNIQTAETNKTQVAVNSEGKTNESTKHIKQPLKSGQKEPDSKEQQDKQKVVPPTKSKGIKR